MMKVHHLSHIDLDGYGCQYLASHFFKNISYYNSNYGSEVSARIDSIFHNIEKEDYDEYLILITDLNLTLNEAELLQERVAHSEKNIDLQLLDHHATGADCAGIFKWYYLDCDRSASKITFDWLQRSYKKPPHKKLEKLKKLTNSINSYDIWREDEYGFEFGKVCSKGLNEARELNRYMFDIEHRIYKFYILDKALGYIEKEHANIKLDNALHKIKKSYLIERDDDTLENLSSKYLITLLGKKLDEITINYKGYKGVLTYALGSISVIANAFLKAHDNYDFFMDISPKGTLSIRADGNINVGEMSKNLFGGGGHPNAAGGKMGEFKESFLYSEVKSRVEKLMNEKG